ncbi:MAG: peptidylprolyl isomerase [Ilumatobacteraceae bacterium]|nr:peptidylprolyl isomerase [Ilumatobacteraceae bacterium]
MLVGTNKRERQKRNRDSRRDQVTRRAQQGKLRKRGMQIAVVVLLVVALVGFVFATGNNSDDTAITETGVDTTEVLDDVTTDEAAPENAAFEFGTSECPPSDGSADQRREFADAHQLCIDPTKSYIANFDTNQGSFTVQLANSGPNTNGSQFFIITGDNGASLPPSYSLFGQVTAGLDTAVAAMAALFNPDPAANGVPPAADIILNSVTISEA